MTADLYRYLCLCALVAWLGLGELAEAQALAEVYGTEAVGAAIADTGRADDSLSLMQDEGIIVDSIVIENREIYDTSDPRYRNFLFRTANRLHIVTKPGVIRRELLVEVGQPFSVQEAEEMARNLRSRYQLVDAWVETERLPNDHLLVRVVTVDQWSLLGGLEMNRDGNRTRYKIGFEERNLLGYNQFVAFDWVLQEADEDYIHAKFRDPRFFGIPYTVTTEYNTDPRNELFSLGLSRPFYTLEQQFAFGATVGRQGGRHDVYEDSLRVGYWQSKADQFDFTSEYRWGSHFTKLGIGAWYSYHSDKVSERQGDSIDFPADSLYHQPSLLVKFGHLDFPRLRRISGFSLLEDVTLNTGADIVFGRAFASDFKSYHYDVVDVTGRIGRKFGANLLLAEHQQTYWFKGDHQLRRSSRSTAKFYNTSISFMTLAMRLQYRTDFSNSAFQPLIIGGTSGLRGYDEYALTGDRAGLLNFETRWFPGIEFLSAMLGAAVFTDVARAWKPGERFMLNSLEYTVGAGLRISLEKATRSEIIRIDVSMTRQGDVQLAFGTGQYF